LPGDLRCESKPAHYHEIGNSPDAARGHEFPIWADSPVAMQVRCCFELGLSIRTETRRLSREDLYGKRKSQRLPQFLRHGLADGFADGHLPRRTPGTVRGAGPRGPLGIFRSTFHAIWFSIHGEQRPVGSRLGRRTGLRSAAEGDLFFCFLAARKFVFVVDTDISGCYKPQKDKPFGGESPNELQSAVASEAADLPGRAGLLSRRGPGHETPHPPREVRTNLFSPPFVLEMVPACT